MLEERLARRCPSSKRVGAALATGHQVRFDKIGRDNSAKATIFNTGSDSDRSFGVVFEIDTADLASLDDAEGDGYARLDDFVVTMIENQTETITSTYIARPDAIDKSLKPFDWYRDLCLAGAIEAGLPAGYIRQLSRIDVVADPQPNRPRRIEALAVLARHKAG